MAFNKNDTGKPPLYHLAFHSEILSEVCHVLEFGAGLYGLHNWKKGCRWSRYVSAFFRHVFAWMSGESRDPATGLSHIAHAICNLMFLFYYEKNCIGDNDLEEKSFTDVAK